MRITTQSRERPYRRLVTVQTWLVAVVVAGVSCALFYLGGRDDLWQHHAGLQAFVNSLGGALMVSVGLGVIWELAGKRAFAREILETARTSTDVEAAGLNRIGVRYLDDPDWEQLFRPVRKLDIFVAYARTWRHSNLSRLHAVAARPGARIRLYLPDPDHPETVRVLAERFNQPKEQLITAIIEARTEFEGLRQPSGAEVTVHYRRGDILFSCYRFDGTAVLTLYSHSRELVGTVPTLVCTDGGSLPVRARRAESDRPAEPPGRRGG